MNQELVDVAIEANAFDALITYIEKISKVNLVN